MNNVRNKSNKKYEINYCSRIFIYMILNIAVIILFHLLLIKSYTKWFDQTSEDGKIITQVSYHEENNSFEPYHSTEIRYDVSNALSGEKVFNLYLVTPHSISQINPETIRPLYHSDYVELHRYYYEDDIYSLRIYWEDYNIE